MKTYIGQIAGHACYMEHISYSCPALRLYGYSNDLQLARAVYRKLARKWNYNEAMEDVIKRHVAV